MKNDRDTPSALSSRPDLQLPLGQMLRSFIFLGLIALGMGFGVEKILFGEKFLFSLGISWMILFISGIFSLFLTHWIQKRYNIGILSLALGSLFRVGFPLLAVLALIFILDNNILIEVMIILIIYYGVFLTFETGIVLKAINKRYK